MPWEKVTPPWKKLPTPWKKVPTASALCSTAACAHGAWRRAKCWQTGCMSRSRRGDWGVLRAINMLLSMFGAICRPFPCKSRIFFSHLQSAVQKVEKFFRGVNRLFQRALCMKCAYFSQKGREKSAKKVWWLCRNAVLLHSLNGTSR